MTREEIKKMLPILVAFAEGKAIESRCVKGDKSLWYDDEDPSFDDDFEYRIKPEPNYRPFKDAEECWAEMLKHESFGWVKSILFKDLALVQRVTTLYVEINRDIIDYKDTLEKFTFADGTPFGVKVEE
nr:MAG TPA: hypothetical protein [Caudoviricetes sp.]